jgi:hypothetical protein
MFLAFTQDRPGQRLLVASVLATVFGLTPAFAQHPAVAPHSTTAEPENVVIPAAEGDSPLAKRLQASVYHLASPELEGRGPGTDGINVAADYIAEQFRSVGLDTKVVDGGPFQPFEVTTGSELGDTNELVLTYPEVPAHHGHGAPTIRKPGPLTLGKDFNPLAFGGSGKVDLPIVFAGYGITAEDVGYDDYAGVDVEGKAVLVLRKTPQQGNPHGLFGADARRSPHAPFTRKISNAYQHGAKAIIFVTDAQEVEESTADYQRAVLMAVDRLGEAQVEFEAKENPTPAEVAAFDQAKAEMLDRIVQLGVRYQDRKDPVLPFSIGGEAAETRDDMPVIHITRAVADALVRSTLETSLESLEKKIDDTGKPLSALLEDARIRGEVSVSRKRAEVKNVIGVLPGKGELAEETLVIGAHYDHLGYGGSGSRVPGVKEIHPGADDNATGSAALAEIARQLVADSRDSQSHRRVVFIAFSAEEMGLIGSSYYVHKPVVPLDKTVAMINLDMIGWLRDEKLIVDGVDTADSFIAILDGVNESAELNLIKKPGGFGPSDHASFYGAQIPVLSFFTDLHPYYHTPEDTPEKINYPGMARVTDFVADTAWKLATVLESPKYQAPQQVARDDAPQGSRPYFGSIPDFGREDPGYALMGVAPNSPAARGGLKGGDVIVQFGDAKIGNLQDFDGALRRFKAGDKAPVTVMRDGERVQLEVVLDPPR